MMFRLRVGGLERLEPPDELAPERLERRVPIEAGESPHLEDGVAEVGRARASRGRPVSKVVLAELSLSSRKLPSHFLAF